MLYMFYLIICRVGKLDVTLFVQCSFHKLPTLEGPIALPFSSNSLRITIYGERKRLKKEMEGFYMFVKKMKTGEMFNTI